VTESLVAPTALPVTEVVEHILAKPRNYLPSPLARMLVTDREMRLMYLADWMAGAGFDNPGTPNAMLIRRGLAEIFLRCMGDLIPAQLYTQNNFSAAPYQAGEAAMQAIPNGRGPLEWAPPAQPEPEQDPVLDAPEDESPIPVPAPEPPAEPIPDLDEDFAAILAGVG
jgi:hypothetical protein